MSLFALLETVIQTSWTKLNPIINYSLTVKTLHNHPIFHSEERLVNLVRGRECFVGLSTYCTTYIISLLWLSYCWPAWCDLQGVCGYSYMHCSTDWLARPEAVVLEILCIWRAVHREAALWIQNWHWTNHDIFLLYSTVLREFSTQLC